MPLKGQPVAPLAGAWIEMQAEAALSVRADNVAPLAGAWIEIVKIIEASFDLTVAPLAGAWIEIKA